MFTDQNPNEILFNKAACSDVGLKCGGWWNIAMEINGKISSCLNLLSL